MNTNDPSSPAPTAQTDNPSTPADAAVGVRCSAVLGEDHWFLKHLMDANTVVLCNNEWDTIVFSAIGMKSFGAIDRQLFDSLVAVMAERKGIKRRIRGLDDQ